MLRYLVLFSFFIFNLTFVSATDPIKKIDPSLNDVMLTKGKGTYIILMKDRKVFDGQLPFNTKNEKAKFVYESLVWKAQSTQKPIIQILKSRKISYQSFYVTNAIKVTSDYETMMLLANRADIERLIHDAPFRMLDYREERSESIQKRIADPEWGIVKVKADSVWAMGYRGQGVVIGGQDTGYDWKVSPLKSKYKGYVDSSNVDHNFNWHDAIHENNPMIADSLVNPCGYSTTEPCDDHNHGTHTMGTMVGEDDENSIGVAPESRWIACRNMDRGNGQPSTYMECFEWFLAPYDLDGKDADPGLAPHVINNSWYCSEDEGCNPSNFVLMEDIVKNLKASGIVVVVSAGNSGSGCGSVTGPPGFFEASFSVGATNVEDNIAGFSSRGPVVIDSSFRLKPNVSAPGVNVRSVIRNGNFASFSGTSMAGPHTAGVVALMINANPLLAGRVEVIEDILESTAVPLLSDQNCGDFSGGDVPNAVYGYGRIDALAAIKRAISFTTSTDQEEISTLKVFPNPVKDLLTFVLNNGNEFIGQIQIFDINGRLVLQQKPQHQQVLSTIVMQDLQNGVYFYTVQTTGNDILNGKVIKI